MSHKSQRRLGVAGAAAAFAVLLATLSAAQAGPIFLPGNLVGGKFVPDKEVKQPCYTVRYSTITATVDWVR